MKSSHVTHEYKEKEIGACAQELFHYADSHLNYCMSRLTFCDYLPHNITRVLRVINHMKARKKYAALGRERACQMKFVDLIWPVQGASPWNARITGLSFWILPVYHMNKQKWTETCWEAVKVMPIKDVSCLIGRTAELLWGLQEKVHLFVTLPVSAMQCGSARSIIKFILMASSHLPGHSWGIKHLLFLDSGEQLKSFCLYLFVLFQVIQYLLEG